MKSTPPVAKRIPHITEIHGTRLENSYHWLREKETPEVVAYLQAENQYVTEVMKPYAATQEAIFEELKGRIPPEDSSVPSRIDTFYYFSRDVPGKQYKVYCRKHKTLDSPEEVLLDLNQLAEGHSYLSMGSFEVSPNHQILAYSLDIDGSEHHTIFFKDLKTGALLLDKIPDASTSLEWAEDDLHIFYTRLDENDRPDRVLRHRLSTESVIDPVVFQETDSRYFVDCQKTRSRKWLIIQSAGKTSTEVRVLPSDQPGAEFLLVAPRREGVEYSLDHHGDLFLVVTNDEGAVNFRVVGIPCVNVGLSQKNFRELIPHDPKRLIEGIQPFRDHLVLVTRENGLPCFSVIDPQTWKEREIEFPEPVYSISPSSNPEFNTDQFRFVYSSFTSPYSVYDYDLKLGTRELKKQVKIPAGPGGPYDASLYTSKRLFAISGDGTQVPIALVFKKDTPLDGTAPVLLYGYGSYGISLDASFSVNRISLLDRGFIFAMAQVRGGAELGRTWYEDGKFLKKKNTFADFIACAEELVAQKYASPREIAIQGGSAGGMLVGTVMNLRPELFKAVVAQVPFVDVINTMLDDTLPLTPTEFEEWGNPKDRTYFDYMLSYSPYDNVKAKSYPHVLITAGYNDPRVTYWEPAKWCAKLRALKTDSNLLLLKTEMGAGHGGATGRYDSLKEVALMYTFLLKVFGKI